MGFWGTLVAVRAEDVPEPLRALGGQVYETLGGSWKIVEVSEDLTGSQVLVDLAALTQAPVLAAYIADSDYGMVTGVSPRGVNWQAWLDRRTAYLFERDHHVMNGVAKDEAVRRARAGIREFGLPPLAAARQAVLWSAELGHQASLWRVWNVLAQCWPPSGTSRLPLPALWFDLTEESFAKLLRLLGIPQAR